MGTFTWPNVESTLADVGEAAKKLGLPFSAEDAKASLLAQAPFKEAVAQVDLTKPIAVVFLATEKGPRADAGASGDKGVAGVAAFVARAGGPATTEAWAKTIGTVVEKRQDAVAVKPALDGGNTGAPDTFYLLVRDGTVLVADAWKSLELGGALALAARSGGAAAKNPTLSVRPEGLARQQGTTLAAALEKARTELKKNMAEATERPPSPVAQVVLDAFLELVFGWVQNTEAIEASVAVDATRGLALTFGLRPATGSHLAQVIASSKPYRAEPALLAGPSPALFAASGESAWMKEMLPVVHKALDALPADQPKKDDLRHLVDLMGEAWTGAGSVAMRANDGLTYDIVYDVEPSRGAGLVEALAKAVGPSPFGDFGALDPSFAGTTFLLEKEGDVFWGRFVSTKAKGDKRRPAGKVGKVPGADGMGPLLTMLANFEMRMTVEGGKMIASSGANNKTRFEALRAAVKTPPAPSPSGEISAALDATQGAAFVEAIDLGAFFKGMAALAGQPGFGGKAASAQQTAALAAMLGDAHLGLYAEARAGDTLALTLHIPMETAASGAMLAARFSAGGAPQLPQPALPPPTAPRKHGKH